jgi:hypothetical protein
MMSLGTTACFQTAANASDRLPPSRRPAPTTRTTFPPGAGIEASRPRLPSPPWSWPLTKSRRSRR